MYMQSNYTKPNNNSNKINYETTVLYSKSIYMFIHIHVHYIHIPVVLMRQFSSFFSFYRQFMTTFILFILHIKSLFSPHLFYTAPQLSVLSRLAAWLKSLLIRGGEIATRFRNSRLFRRLLVDSPDDNVELLFAVLRFSTLLPAAAS